MDVHIRKFHTDNFECGLCDKDLGNLDKLCMHLKTYEIHRCRRCHKKEISITNIKAHTLQKHYGNGVEATLIDHIKISRNNSDEVTSNKH